jgi:PhoPQ-activated pathogenicity-related protein
MRFMSLPSAMIFICSLVLVFINTATSTSLDDYVWAEDSAYGWTDLGQDYVYKGKVANRGYTSYVLNMTSQRWLTDADFSADSLAKSLWWHYLVIIVPDDLRFKNNGSIWITGGSQGNGIPKSTDEDVYLAAALAVTTGTVTSVLFQIPNEHITFSADPIQKSRSEDAIIAFTWDHFLNDPSQPNWLVRFPMVKASLRAMDASKEFILQKRPDLGVSLDYYVVSGASKRGWTTWLVGAVDPNRVKVIVPVVLDAINFVAVEHHEFRSYGAWSYALQDYTDMNLTMRFDDPNMKLLQEAEDPYFYRDRLTMPKLVVNAGMDEFQQPDDTHYWWNDMPEPKHFLIAPNAEHSLATGILEVVPAIGAFALSHLLNESPPTFTWTINEATGEIIATVDNNGVVHEANVWWAYSCGVNAWDNNINRRDWRVAHLDQPCTCGLSADGYCANLKAIWYKQPLEATMVRGKRTYSAKIAAPDDGRWVAFFIDFKFVNKNAVPIDIANMYKTKTRYSHEDGHFVRFTDKYGLDPAWGGFPHDFGRFFEFTTEVSIWPNVFPYPDCAGADCGVQLV